MMIENLVLSFQTKRATEHEIRKEHEVLSSSGEGQGYVLQVS